MKKTYDYMIAGQGIAGTTLAYTLLRKGHSVLLFDKYNPFSSSRMAGGIVNPITGRKMIKTWMADTLFDKLHSFYPEMEEFLGKRFFYPINIFFPFESQEKQTDWMSASADEKYENYIVDFHADGIYQEVNQAYGGMEVQRSGFLEVVPFLEAFKKYMETNGDFVEQKLEAKDLTLTEKGVIWNDIQAKKVIFAEGANNPDNPYFNWLDFRNVKGEVLMVKFKNARFNHIINRNGFIIPIDQEGTCKVGATYEYHQLDNTPTEKGKEQLLEKLHALCNDEYEILDHWAGIRPATYDRRPFIGLHHEYPQVGIFNGLGTKGVSLAPYFAEHFYHYLENGEPLMPEIDFQRQLRRKKGGRGKK
ncbi:FAD-dependent oxidoreductase [Algivirga pacifica]|uniref:FAD-dependent oxidoreductase n=1 Tax=Algivirga pacifica TaxID=1162670 RepID=A0ABP9DE83_9BACT